MHILVTAGNTQTPIDDVRCITNVFTGRTGSAIAVEAASRQHTVKLLTSQPELAETLAVAAGLGPDRLDIAVYRTFDDLQSLLEVEMRARHCDAVVHSAAVSDYRVVGVYASTTAPVTEASGAPVLPVLHDARAGKVKSTHRELWLRLLPTVKLIDQFREPWGFGGVLVKFKLEVGKTEEELTAIAEQSRQQSRADLMAANCFESRSDWALLGPVAGRYERVPRSELAQRLVRSVEDLAAGSGSA